MHPHDLDERMSPPIVNNEGYLGNRFLCAHHNDPTTPNAFGARVRSDKTVSYSCETLYSTSFFFLTLTEEDSSIFEFGCVHCITKTCVYNFDPFKPHFYIVKLEFTGIRIIFLFLLKNIDCVYSLKTPRQGISNEYPQSIFWAKYEKDQSFFFIWNFSFWRWNFQYIWIGVFS